MTEQEPLKKRKRQALETRERIFRAALDLIHEKGVERVQIEDISRRAGVSMGLFYKYFPSKADVISEAVVHRSETGYREIYEEKLGDTQGLCRILLFVYHVTQLHLHLYGLPELRLHFSNLLLSAQRSNWTLDSDRMIYVLFQEGLSQAIKSGEIPPHVNVVRSSRHLAIVLHGAVFEYLLHGSGEHFELVSDSLRLCTTFLGGLSTPEGRAVLSRWQPPASE